MTISADMKQVTSVDAEAKGIARRTVVKGAAWSVPVIALAVSTPLAQASTVACPSMGLWWGDENSWVASNLNGNLWTSASTATMTVGFGNPAAGGYPAFAMSAAQPVFIQENALSYTYTLNCAVNWTSIPAGWSLTGSTSSGGTWTYVFTYTGSRNSAVLTSSTAPGTTIVPTATASGTVIASSIPVGTDTNSTAFKTYTASIHVNYTPTFTQSPGCTSVNGNDGVPRDRTYSSTRTRA